MKKDFKYYMNAPCIVIREITKDFSEVQVFPEFRDDLEGRMWCTECMVGNSGTPTKHSCEEYQEVIDTLNEIENSMIIIVENRLLADDPIELKEFKSIKLKISEEYKKFLNAQESVNKKVTELDIYDAKLKDINNMIENQNIFIQENNKTIDKLNNIISDLQKKITITLPKNINITEDDYIYLKQRDFILTRLENGGVDNWEWYSESYPSDEEIDEIKTQRA